MRSKFAIIPAFAVALLALTGAAQSNVQVGSLECRTGPRVGLVVGSVHWMQCVFKSNQGAPQRYIARQRRIGLDLGITAGGVSAWAVFAPSNSVAPGGLAGRYGGVSGDVALGLGVGAKALVGGSKHSIALQPFSVEGQVGVAVAAGITGLTLQYQP
jgi:Protein of unknown function (DUF992)